jgi:hypothetical protein
MHNASSQPHGTLGLRRIPAPPVRPVILTHADALRHGGGLAAHPELARRGVVSSARKFGKSALLAKMAWQEENAPNFERSLAAAQAAEDAARGGAIAIIGNLWLAHVDLQGRQQDLGLASCRVVTTAGVNYIVDAFQNLTELENLKYHGVGTGAAAEAVGNTALTTELTTQYSVASTRPTGTTGEQAGNANVYETVATITVSAGVALTEHGIFSQAAVAGGTMLDRTTFAAVNLLTAESLQATYQFTVVAGG